MTTQSQLVDDMVAELMRPDMRSTIVGYVALTIRELHGAPDTGAAIGYDSNLVELALTANLDTGFMWTIPSPNTFQYMEAVYYPQIDKYAKKRYPSSAWAFADEVDGNLFWYRSGTNIAFSGYGGNGSLIDLAYFSFPREMIDFPTAATRPCTWDKDAQAYSYLGAITDPVLQAAARARCTNWLLERWEDLVKQGVRAKVFARLGDIDRGKLAYSLYQAQRPVLIAAETQEHTATYYK